MDNIKISESQLDDAVKWIIDGSLPPQEKVLVTLLLRNGLRVSEITEPSHIRKIDDWSVSVYCRKSNVWRTCVLAEAAEIEKRYNVIQSIGFWTRNRWYYYRLLKGLLPAVQTNRTGNVAVTHAARNIRAQIALNATASIEAAAAAVGHKSTKSTRQYIPRSRKGAIIKQGIEGTVSGTIGSVQLTKKGVMRNSRQQCN